MRLFVCLLFVSCSVLTAPGARARAADAQLQAGFGVVDITPKLDGKSPI